MFERLKQWWNRPSRNELEGRIYDEQLRLAACGVAALGYLQEGGCPERCKSGALTDVFALRRTMDYYKELAANAVRQREEMRDELAAIDRVLVGHALRNFPTRAAKISYAIECAKKANEAGLLK